jgi:hypothetical protein
MFGNTTMKPLCTINLNLKKERKTLYGKTAKRGDEGQDTAI